MGDTFPLYCTANGKAYLAQSPQFVLAVAIGAATVNTELPLPDTDSARLTIYADAYVEEVAGSLRDVPGLARLYSRLSLLARSAAGSISGAMWDAALDVPGDRSTCHDRGNVSHHVVRSTEGEHPSMGKPTFGIFDHIDDAGTPLGQLYADRLTIAEAYDRAGFYGYHVAEHHTTPLGAAASPALIFAALSQTTAYAYDHLLWLTSVTQPDPDGTSPLLLTLINGHWDTAKLLIESGANVNDWDFWGQSPLYIAVDMNILPAGYRVELPRMDSATGIDVVKLLLAHGAKVNATESWQGQSALMWAASEDHGAVVAARAATRASANRARTSASPSPASASGPSSTRTIWPTDPPVLEGNHPIAPVERALSIVAS